MNARTALLVAVILVAVTGCDIFNPQNNEPEIPQPPVIPDGPPDLVISLSGPAAVQPGEDIGPQLVVEIGNIGGGIALGTRDAEGNSQEGGYFIDFVMSSDEIVPAGYANFSDEYFEDVLLRGGRKTDTPNLIAPTRIVVPEESSSIPDSIPLGEYYICAYIDPGNVIDESDETNNVGCFRTRVVELAKN